MKEICAVIPAAGKGTRLDGDIPKILFELKPGLRVIDVLFNELKDDVDKIVLVVSPDAYDSILDYVKMKGYTSIELAIQKKPIGMGDAVFCAYDGFKDFDNIIIVWGDQINLSKQTIKEVVERQIEAGGFTLPIVKRSDLYVEYVFDKNNQLVRVLEKREGDKLSDIGLSDIGMFAVSVKNLYDVWNAFLSERIHGKGTGEINFLNFLPYLGKNGWRCNVIKVSDPTEAIGLNDKKEWEFFLKNNKRY